MKVKIVRCKRNYYWYVNKINVNFEVKDFDNTYYLATEINHLIEKEDCIILKEEKMNKQKLKNQIEEMESKLVEMKQELENVEEVDWLQDDVEYWYINNSGNIDWTIYNSSSGDKYRKSVGNTYKTKALAERKRDKIKNDWVLQKLAKVQNYVENFEEDFVCDFRDNDVRNYYVYYDWNNKFWNISYHLWTQNANCYMNKETAERVVAMLRSGEL